MHAVTVRFPQFVISYVRSEAKKRRMSEANIWRDLVDSGIYNANLEKYRSGEVFNLTVQNLCLLRRLAGHVDESLIDQANEDARRALGSFR